MRDELVMVRRIHCPGANIGAEAQANDGYESLEGRQRCCKSCALVSSRKGGGAGKRWCSSQMPVNRSGRDWKAGPRRENKSACIYSYFSSKRQRAIRVSPLEGPEFERFAADVGQSLPVKVTPRKHEKDPNDRDLWESLGGRGENE